MSDRDGDLARADGAGITEPRGRQTISGNLDDRKIAVGMAAGDDPGELAPVVENDVRPIVADDVPVRDDDAVRAPDNPGAVASTLTDENNGRFDLRDDVRN